MNTLVTACRKAILQGTCGFTNKINTCKQSAIYFPEIIKLSVFNVFAIGNNARAVACIHMHC